MADARSKTRSTKGETKPKTDPKDPKAAKADGKGDKYSKADLLSDVDDIMKFLVFLYSENRRVTKAIAATASLTGPQLTVIKMLEQMGAMSLSELSEAIRAQNSTVTGIVDRMERDDLVERVRSTQDRRVVHIRLTDKGRKLALGVPVEPILIFRNALRALQPGEVKLLHRTLQRLTDNVRAAVSKDLKDLPTVSD